VFLSSLSFISLCFINSPKYEPVSGSYLIPYQAHIWDRSVAILSPVSSQFWDTYGTSFGTVRIIYRYCFWFGRTPFTFFIFLKRHLSYVWVMYGYELCMVHVWKEYEESMEKAWESHGKAMGKPWERHGRSMSSSFFPHNIPLHFLTQLPARCYNKRDNYMAKDYNFPNYLLIYN